jgi:uncharacterized protein
MPLLDGLKVIRSSIHGYGVETTRRFSEGEVIVYGDGVLYREDEDFDDEYCLILPGYEPGEDGEEGPAMYWDLACQTRWINHSCSPNTEVDTDWDEDKQTVVAWWTALRDIEAGEELTYDYAFAGHLAMPCRCGSPECRGLIVDPDELGEIPGALRHLLRLAPPGGRRAATRG